MNAVRSPQAALHASPPAGTHLTLPNFDDVRAAAQRLDGVAHRTPVLRSRALNEEFGAELFFKCENLQRVGAFKFRGGYNAIAKLDAERRRAGVLTYSAGNHGQAVALAARLFGIPSTVVMPHDSPQVKVDATRGYGAKIVLYDRYTEDRVAISEDLAQRDGATIIPPYDHPDVIAGQGTAAMELFEDIGPLDALFAPLGGGGLLAGSALATRALSPDCRLFGVEPLAGNDGQQSFRAGHIVAIDAPKTIADGAQTKFLGQHNFALIQRHVDDILTATDPQLVDCMRFFASRMKLLVEPTGCLGLAAAREMQSALQGRRIGILISGGNVDLQQLGALLTR